MGHSHCHWQVHFFHYRWAHLLAHLSLLWVLVMSQCCDFIKAPKRCVGLATQSRPHCVGALHACVRCPGPCKAVTAQRSHKGLLSAA